MRTALFPGSFDPFTLGHYDVLKSALRIFEKVVVAVGYNSNKQGFFSPDNRVKIIEESVSDLISDNKDSILITTYTGLTIDFCRKMEIEFIIRGLRTTTDFELESVIAQANKKLSSNIGTIFIPASQEYSFISSTVVRDVLINGGDPSAFLHPSVDFTKYLSLKESR